MCDQPLESMKYENVINNMNNKHTKIATEIRNKKELRCSPWKI